MIETAAMFDRLAERALALASKVSPRAARIAGGRLTQQRRLEEAEALLSRAATAFPRHPGVLARYAFVAQARERFAEAAERWNAVCTLAPQHATAWGGLALAARSLGDMELAKRAITRALSLRPDNWHIVLEAARIHDRADRPDEAIEFWSRLATRRGADPIWRQGYADCLIRLHRLEEAEREIDAGLLHRPGHRGLVASKGLLAMRREDWENAAAIWSAYVAAFPEDGIGHGFLSRVDSVRRLAAALQQAPPPRMRGPIDVGRVDDPALRMLMLRFEGIGTDCEFGTVQRRYGAEPLGLLRWNDVSFATLASALEAGFAAMGEPENTELFADEFGRLYIRDRRWDLGMHTFLYEREVARETLYPQMCRRVAYLRDKFLADLATAEKVLVYKADELSIEDLSRLHELLLAHGPIRLLHVRSASWAGIPPWPEGESGTIAAIAPNLLVGYLEWMGDLDRIRFDDWIAICRATVDLIEPVTDGFGNQGSGCSREPIGEEGSSQGRAPSLPSTDSVRSPALRPGP